VRRWARSVAAGAINAGGLGAETFREGWRRVRGSGGAWRIDAQLVGQ
jgi:hypothetical protein